jgi:hypothetical protein
MTNALILFGLITAASALLALYTWFAPWYNRRAQRRSTRS